MSERRVGHGHALVLARCHWHGSDVQLVALAASVLDVCRRRTRPRVSVLLWSVRHGVSLALRDRRLGTHWQLVSLHGGCHWAWQGLSEVDE